MRKAISIGLMMLGFATLSACALLDDEDVSPQRQAHVQQKYEYDPLRFQVKVKYEVTFNYTPRDRARAADYFISEFQSQLVAKGNNGNGYLLAEGVRPQMLIHMFVNSDASNNLSMSVEVTGPSDAWGVAPGGEKIPYDYTISTDATYQDEDKMIDDMAGKVDSYTRNGWWKTQ